MARQALLLAPRPTAIMARGDEFALGALFALQGPGFGSRPISPSWATRPPRAHVPFGVTTGVVLNAMSGTPTSTEWAMDYQGYFPFGRADQARAPFLWFANFYIEYNLKLGKNTLNINLNVDNAFDIKTAQRIYPIYNQGAVAISEDRIAQGPWNINDYAPVLDPRYLMESDFYAPLTARLGFKFSF